MYTNILTMLCGGGWRGSYITHRDYRYHYASRIIIMCGFTLYFLAVYTTRRKGLGASFTRVYCVRKIKKHTRKAVLLLFY